MRSAAPEGDAFGWLTRTCEWRDLGRVGYGEAFGIQHGLVEQRKRGEIADQFAVTRPAISHHLGVLRKAGLLRERRAGTKRLYRISPEAVDELRSFIDGFWEPRLRRLKRAAEAFERSKRER